MTNRQKTVCGDGDEIVELSPDSQCGNNDMPRGCRCTEEDLRAGARFFDFDPELVERALGKDRCAFEKLCTQLMAKYDRLEARIRQLCPGWPTEQVDRVYDLFIDRFVRLFGNPPEDLKIDNVSALCWTFLLNSITDSWRFFRAARRNVGKTVYGDATREDDEGQEVAYWDTHAAEILAHAGTGWTNRIKMSDLQDWIRECLCTEPSFRQKAYRLWLAGYTEMEIASRTDMTKSNVGTSVSRINARLRKKILQEM